MVVGTSEETHKPVRKTSPDDGEVDPCGTLPHIAGTEHRDCEEAVLDRRKVDDLAAELHIWAAVELADAEEGGLHEREGGLGPFALLDDRLAGNIVVRFAKKIEIGNTTVQDTAAHPRVVDVNAAADDAVGDLGCSREQPEAFELVASEWEALSDNDGDTVTGGPPGQ